MIPQTTFTKVATLKVQKNISYSIHLVRIDLYVQFNNSFIDINQHNMCIITLRK